MTHRRHSGLLVISVMASCFLLAAAASAQTVDQYDLAGDINWAVHSSSDIGQTFTPGTSGRLVGVELALSRCNAPANPLVLEILTVSGGVPQSSPVLASVQIPNASIPLSTPPTSLVLGSVTGTYIDLTGYGIHVQPTRQYAFRLSTAEGVCYATRGDTLGAYTGGQRFTVWTPDPANDLVFKTFLQPVEPIPASSPLAALLLLAAIAGVGYLFLRR